MGQINIIVNQVIVCKMYILTKSKDLICCILNHWLVAVSHIRLTSALLEPKIKYTCNVLQGYEAATTDPVEFQDNPVTCS